MHDYVTTAVRFLPREVVMVLDSRDDSRTEQLCYQSMNDVVISRRVVAHQVHGRPVFLTGLIVETQPRETADIGVPLRQQVASDVAVGVTDGGSRAATAAVTEQRDVLARVEI